MEKVGLLVRLVAKPGKEEEVAAFLKSALPLAQQEPLTLKWYAIRVDHATFVIFDSFEAEAGRTAHLQGPIAAALMAHAPDLLAVAPVIEQVEVMAVK